MSTHKKRALMVVFEFPPCNGSSIQRIISVYNGFISMGWDVDVITANPMAHENVLNVDTSLLNNPNGSVKRVFALDAQRHLSFKGKHIGVLSSPDRWGKTWIPMSVIAGLKLIKKNKPDLIWSSSPTPSPHLIASKLKEKSGVPWVADYRDPFPYMHNRAKSYLDAAHKKTDHKVLCGADVITFATVEAKELFLKVRGVDDSPEYFVFENGFNKSLMEEVKRKRGKGVLSGKRKNFITLYYAGILYKDGREPGPLFEALKLYKENGVFDFELIFQGAGSGSEHKETITQLGLENHIIFKEGIPFKDAVSEMLKADVLVLIQDEKFNNQVPGKLYEYLATNNYILIKSPKESASNKVATNYPGVFSGYCAHSIYQAILDIERERKTMSNIRRDVDEHSRERIFEAVFKKITTHIN